MGLTSFSQRWHFQYGFKIGAGKNFYMGEPEVNKGYSFNYLLGFTGRVTKKDFIIDVGINYQYSPYFNSSFYGRKRTNTSVLNVPATLGIILVNKPLFKWNLQGGIQNSFVFTRGFDQVGSPPTLYSPYQLSGIISTGIEVSWFILDIYYQPGITKMFRYQETGFNQSINITLGLIF